MREVSWPEIVAELKTHVLIWSMIVLCVLVFAYFKYAGLDALHILFVPQSVSELWQLDQFWRLWSPALVHYTFLHLATNLYLWWLLARSVEQQSKGQLFILVLLSAAFGNALQWWWQGPNFGGLSGVVYALLSFNLVSYYFTRLAQYRVDPMISFLLFALLPLAMLDLSGFKLATYAHLGGLLMGVFMALINSIKIQQVIKNSKV